MSWDNNKGPWGRRPNPPSGKPSDTGPRSNEGLDTVLKEGQARLRRLMGGANGPRGRGSQDAPNPQKFFLFLGALAALIWLSTGFYVVNTEEQAVILRFGKYHRTTNPGLNYHFPAPIEKEIKLAVTTIHQEEIGGRGVSTPTGSSFGFGRDSAGTYASNSLKERLMLTGDSNIVDVNFVVQWRISNAQNYLFNVRDNFGESSVKNAAESALREVIGKTELEAVLAKERSRIEEDSKRIIQSILDSYHAGIEIVRVQMLDSDPPEDVLDAFRSVEAARAEKETKKNEAERERNKIIPDARGRARQLVEEALAYKQQTIARAVGEADRFLAVYNEYKAAKGVTSERLYLETMESVLKDMPKLVLDNKGTQGVLPYLPLNSLEKKATPAPKQ